MTDELVDVINEKDEVVGQEWKTICHKKGLLHRVGAVFIFNNKGQLLLQERSLKKSLGAGLYDYSSCGHIAAGENYERGARKELNEELGIYVPIKLFSNEISLEISTRYAGITVKHKIALFLGYNNGPFKIQKEELDSVAFYDLETIQKMISQNPDSFAEGFKLGFKTYIKKK